MQDKDIDQLFHNKLEHLEVKPSANVWSSIVIELDSKKKKNSLMPVIRIAATITVFLTAGLFFLLRDYKLPQNFPKDALIKDHQIINPVKENALKHGKTVISHSGSKSTAVAQAKKHPTMQVVVAAVRNIQKKPLTTPQENIAGTKPTDQREERQPLAAVTDAGAAVDQPVLPEGQLNIKTTVAETDGFIKPVNAVLANLPVVKTKSKRHSIRNLGDLINVVVARVDKRENKVIEFTDTDDDSAVLTGVNLGIVRVKKVK